MSMHDDIKTILVSEEQLKAKVAELGAQIRIMPVKIWCWCPSSRARWSLWPT